MKGGKCMTPLMLIGLVGMMMVVKVALASHNYGDALTKSILFFEGQRSGKLPSNQRITWRKDSALHDGSDIGMDLVGGYYDAGDNVKFNFPMAFTTTMLAWSVIEFGQFMGPDLQHLQDAVRWGTDYFLKATNKEGTVVAQIGEPIADHNCWERPEDMDTPRTTYVVNKTHPRSELSGEIAAALAASSLVFKSVDDAYSKTLLDRASKVFDFSHKYQGSYNLTLGQGVCQFYCGVGGYGDELVWAAAWLYKATQSQNYFEYVVNGINNVGGGFEFGWDSKGAGINVLLSLLVMNSSYANPFVQNADYFVCSLLPESPTKSVTYSQGGLIFKIGPSNAQHVTALSFLLTVYARYMKKFGRTAQCGANVVATPSKLVKIARTQVDYILGSNPLGMSYMVGYGNKFPQKIHHRGSTLPSVDQHPDHIKCHDGSRYFGSENPNPNLLIGAVVGGPDDNDRYEDGRVNVSQSEPTTYINAPFVGVLAYFKALSSS